MLKMPKKNNAFILENLAINNKYIVFLEKKGGLGLPYYS